MKQQDSEVTKKYLEEAIQMIDSHIKPQSNDYVFWKQKQEELIKRLEKMND